MRDRRIESALWALLDARRAGATVCPSEVARAVSGEDWRDLMDPVREEAARLAAEGMLEVTQAGEVINLDDARGPVRLRRPLG